MNASTLLKPPALPDERRGAENLNPDILNAGEPLTIGEVSRLYGVTLRALRFYEQRGLLAPIRRGGARFMTAPRNSACR